MIHRALRPLSAILLAAWLAIASAAAQSLESVPPARKLTPQQQKLRTCGAEWQAMKQEGKTQGITWAQYRRDCLRRGSS